MYGYLRDAIVDRTLRTMEDLIRNAEAVPPDKLEWHAIGKSRTVLDLVRECCEVNERWAQILREKRWVDWSPEQTQAYYDSMVDLPAAVAKLRETTASYVDSVRAVPYEELQEVLELPWTKLTMAEALIHAVWHMSYHEGQISYIQTLYGDWNDH